VRRRQKLAALFNDLRDSLNLGEEDKASILRVAIDELHHQRAIIAGFKAAAPVHVTAQSSSSTMTTSARQGTAGSTAQWQMRNVNPDSSRFASAYPLLSESDNRQAGMTTLVDVTSGHVLCSSTFVQQMVPDLPTMEMLLLSGNMSHDRPSDFPYSLSRLVAPEDWTTLQSNLQSGTSFVQTVRFLRPGGAPMLVSDVSKYLTLRVSGAPHVLDGRVKYCSLVWQVLTPA